MTTHHDAGKRLWAEILAVHKSFAADKLQLGKLFCELRNLYSERNSGGGRLTYGHGTFEPEIKARGFSPRRVREWINDHEVATGLRRPTESESAKRGARRATRTNHVLPARPDDAISRFAAL